MSKSRFSLLIIAVAVLLPRSSAAQCPTMPPDSPVVSNSPDDIPASDVDVLLFNGSHGKLHATNAIAFVEISDNEQKVWFGGDRVPGAYRTFYNRRYRANASSPWYWQYSVSPTIFIFSQPSSVDSSSVLYSPTPKYVDVRTNTAYEYLTSSGLKATSTVS